MIFIKGGNRNFSGATSTLRKHWTELIYLVEATLPMKKTHSGEWVPGYPSWAYTAGKTFISLGPPGGLRWELSTGGGGGKEYIGKEANKKQEAHSQISGSAISPHWVLNPHLPPFPCVCSQVHPGDQAQRAQGALSENRPWSLSKGETTNLSYSATFWKTIAILVNCKKQRNKCFKIWPGESKKCGTIPPSQTQRKY